MPITTPAQLALAERVHHQITTHPHTHSQGAWWRESPCGTTACVAGWTCILDGAVIRKDLHAWPLSERLANYAARTGDEPKYIPDYARTALGLTDAEADELFFACRDSEDAADYLTDLIEQARI